MKKKKYMKRFDDQIWQFKCRNKHFNYMKALVVFHKHIYVLSKGFDRKVHVLIKMSKSNALQVFRTVCMFNKKHFDFM